MITSAFTNLTTVSPPVWASEPESTRRFRCSSATHRVAHPVGHDRSPARSLAGAGGAGGGWRVIPRTANSTAPSFANVALPAVWSPWMRIDEKADGPDHA
jgi:hypothetical protein